MSLHQFNHPRSSHTQMRLAQRVIDTQSLHQTSSSAKTTNAHATYCDVSAFGEKGILLHFCEFLPERGTRARMMATAPKNFGSSALNAKNKFRDYILWENLRRLSRSPLALRTSE